MFLFNPTHPPSSWQAVVRKSLAAKAETQPATSKAKLPPAQRSALDRFRK